MENSALSSARTNPEQKYRYFLLLAVSILPLLAGYAIGVQLRTANCMSTPITVAADGELSELQSIALSHPSFDSLFVYGFTLYQRNRFADSIVATLAALAFDSHSAPAWTNVCAAFNMLGQPVNAANACRKALEVDPNYALAKNNLLWSQTMNVEGRTPPPAR